MICFLCDRECVTQISGCQDDLFWHIWYQHLLIHATQDRLCWCGFRFDYWDGANAKAHFDRHGGAQTHYLQSILLGTDTY
jgi:hypothetical protein